MLSFLSPDDLMMLRSVCKQTCNSIQSYAYLLSDRTLQLLNPYNIFARSIMLNSFKTITPAFKSNKVFCTCCHSKLIVTVKYNVTRFISKNLLSILFSVLESVSDKTTARTSRKMGISLHVEIILTGNLEHYQGLQKQPSFNIPLNGIQVTTLFNKSLLQIRLRSF
jgi:hypothetical protein